jgi:hypothetical protein
MLATDFAALDHADHHERAAREEAFNRIRRLSAMLEAQDRSHNVADAVMARAMFIAAEADVHSRRGSQIG